MSHPQLDRMPYKDFSLPKPPHKERLIIAGPLPDLSTCYPMPCPLCEREGVAG